MLKQEQVKTPELKKIQAVQDESQKIGGFLAWLTEQGIVLAEWDDEDKELFQIHHNREQLLAKYFEIDLAKCEQERRALLDAVREDNG